MPRDTRHRAYAFTWNNYPPDYRVSLEQLPAKYVVTGEELAPGTGTPHLQGYVVWTDAKTLASCRGLLPGCHITPTRGTHRQNFDYCTKGQSNIYTRGTLPSDPADRGNAERARYEAAWNAAKLGRLEDIPADIRIRHYASIRRIERDYMAPVERLVGPCGLWIHGLSGSGKSRSVLDRFPDLYPKPRNTWWDGYQREPVVLLDDVDKFDVRLGGHLKHWADAYPFIAEIKGGSQKIRPSKLIVTSQYKIEDIWSDPETLDALRRRFVVVEKILGQNILF